MPLVTEVHISQLDLSSRLDAEHYSPRFVPILEQLRTQKIVKLGRSLSEPVKTGHTPSTKVMSYYDPGVIKFIKTDNVREDRLDTQDIQLLSELGNSKIAASELRENDVIVTIIGATEEIIGRAARIPPNLGRANINQNIALIRSNIPSGYLVAFLNTKYGREQLIWLSRQTGQVNLNCREVEEVQVPLFVPQFIESIQKLNSHRQRLLNDSASRYMAAEQLLLSDLALVDWKPAHTLTYIRQYSDTMRAQRSDAEYFHPKYEALFDKLNPSLRLIPLGKLGTFTKGIEVGSSAYANSGIPFWRVSNLTEYGLDRDNLNYIDNELYQVLRGSYEPKQGELLLSKDASPGVAFYLELPIEGVVSSGILRLTLTDAIPPHYLELALNSIFIQLQIEQDSGGSVIKHWKPSSVRRTLIPRLRPSRENELAELVQQSHAARREAKFLLDKAKRAVGIAIEEGEKNAEMWLKEEVNDASSSVHLESR